MMINLTVTTVSVHSLFECTPSSQSESSIQTDYAIIQKKRVHKQTVEKLCLVLSIIAVVELDFITFPLLQLSLRFYPESALIL